MMSCNYCVGDSFKIFFGSLRCFLYFPQFTSLFKWHWTIVTINVDFIWFYFKSHWFNHLIQSIWFFNPFCFSHVMPKVFCQNSCINSHSWAANNIYIRCWRFWRIILVLFVKEETFFMFYSIFINSKPFGAHWSSHVNIFIFRIRSRNVIKKLHKHSIVAVTFCANPF